MSFWDPTLICTTVTPISQVFVFAMSLLQVAENLKVQGWRSPLLAQHLYQSL